MLTNGQGVACCVTATMGLSDARNVSEASWNVGYVVLLVTSIFLYT